MALSGDGGAARTLFPNTTAKNLEESSGKGPSALDEPLQASVM